MNAYRTIISASVAASLFLSSAAMAAMPTYDSAAPVAFMQDVSSGAVLFARDADKRMPPASMAKMMTTYVVFDLIDKGKLKLTDKAKVTTEIWKQWNNQGSTMFLVDGSEVSIEDLLHGVVTLSGNDACVVLATHIAGGEPQFAKLMNKAAKELGLKNSHFGNSNGWPDEGVTYVTARDLSTLGVATFRHFPELYRKFYGQPSFTWNKVTQPNRNPLLGKVTGADGIKTGHTEEAGYGFVGSAEQNGRRLVMVVAGLDSFSGREKESVRFMNWGFDAWEARPLFKANHDFGKAKVQQGTALSVGLRSQAPIALSLPKGYDGKLTARILYKGPIKAPIAKGAEIATLEVTGPGIPRQAIPLVAADGVDEGGFFSRLWLGFLSLFGA